MALDFSYFCSERVKDYQMGNVEEGSKKQRREVIFFMAG